MALTPRMIAFALIVSALVVAWEVLNAQYEPKFEPYEPPEEFRTRLHLLERDAIESAYKDYVKSLFGVWMKDSHGQPERAARGVNQARKAYVDSIKAIDDKFK